MRRAGMWLLLASAALWGQGAPIAGVVVASNGLPVAGATVRAGGASAVSGPDGRFTLTAEADALRVTAPGYAPVQVKLTAEAARAGVRVVLYP
ncbi:MAG: carboxypeptidase-like regulatory domain-containing protein, partial [Terriglobales bacterium]